jgi:hypothetical protein
MEEWGLAHFPRESIVIIKESQSGKEAPDLQHLNKEIVQGG